MIKPLFPSLVIASMAALTTPAGASLYDQPASSARQAEWQWFIGLTASYLFEYDEPMFTGNLGVISPWSPMGWTTSLYFEGGRIEDDNESEIPLGIPGGRADLQVVPLTLNVKFERAVNDHVGLYFGGGAGVSFTEFIVAGQGRDQDTLLTAQVFAGVNFYLGENSEINLGARYIHFDDAENYDMDGTFAAEIGCRWKF